MNLSERIIYGQRCPKFNLSNAKGICTVSGEPCHDHAASGICPDTPNRFNLSPEELAALQTSPPAPPQPAIQPVPRDQWPPRVTKIAELAQPTDKGIGSLLERLIADNEARLQAAKIIADEFGAVTTIKAAFLWATGQANCGCKDRRDMLDARYPLS